MDKDEQTCLTWGDMKVETERIEGKPIKVIKLTIKSPKVDRVGNGDIIAIFETGLFNCPVNALKKWQAVSQFSERKDLPVFRLRKDKCYTGREFNQKLGGLTQLLTDRITGGKFTSHSFRAGVSSEMCRSAYSEQDIMAVGRWNSEAWKLYCKLPMTRRAILAREISLN